MAFGWFLLKPWPGQVDCRFCGTALTPRRSLRLFAEAVGLALCFPISLLGISALLPEGPLSDLFLTGALVATLLAMPFTDWVAWGSIEFDARDK